MDVLYIIMMCCGEINTLVAYGADPHTHTPYSIIYAYTQCHKSTQTDRLRDRGA